MRGFGLAYNRAGIEIARVNMEIDYQTFRQQVRDTLFSVEQAYWQLASARRTVMILAEMVGQNWVTYNSIVLRGQHDATRVQLENARSRWKSREVQYTEAVKTVLDVEDRLKNLLNDPDLLLSDDVEIVPTDMPLVTPMMLDQFAEVRMALDQRSEMHSARLAIEQARIQTLRAKNETLPQLDLAFNYEVQGLGPSADRGFDNVTTNRYRSYSVSVTFTYPLGNRGPRAAYHRADLEERRAITGLHRVLDGVVTDVNNAVRQLMFRYKQIPPQLESVVAAHGNLRAMQDRAEVIDPLYLETELNTIERLGSERQTLLGVVVDYNIALAQLESAKGTLLEYYNVTISDEPE